MIIKQAEVSLFARIMNHDLNLGEVPELTIACRITSENTNDAGDPLLPETTRLMLFEFKKFIFLCGIEINRVKRTQNDKFHAKESYVCPFVPPAYIDRVWKTMILYYQNYHELCELVCGGFIERLDVRSNPEVSFQKYRRLLHTIENNKQLV